MAEKAANFGKEQAKKQAKKGFEKAIKKAGKSVAKSAASSTTSITAIGAFFSTPVGWAVLVIILIIIGIILVIGFIGFFVTMPGLTREKISEFYDKTITTIENFYGDPTKDDFIEVNDEEKVNLANYIDELGYDIIGYGFLDRVERDIDDKDDDGDTDEIIEVVSSDKDYLYAYILANERTYSFHNYGETKWNKFLDKIKTAFLPGYAHKKLVQRLLPGDEHTEAQEGMIDVLGWADGLSSEMFDSMYIERDENNSQNVRLVTKRWNPESKNWWDPRTWGGITNVDTFSWNMYGWTPRYGKPLELSLALHLSTMAPDFAYDFCMDKNLQTSVRMKTAKMTYNAEYKYLTSNPNIEPVTVEEINNVYDSIMPAEKILEYNKKVTTTENIIEADENGDGPILPIGIMENISVVNVYLEGEIGNEYRKLVDENNHPMYIMNIATRDDNISGNYYINYFGDDHGFHYNDGSGRDGEVLDGTFLSNDCGYTTTNEGSRYVVEIKTPSLTDIINMLKYLDDESFSKIDYNLGNWLNALGGFSANTIDAYIDGTRPENRTYEYRNNMEGSYTDEFFVLPGELDDYGRDYVIERLELIQENFRNDYENALNDFKTQVEKDNEELNKWNMDIETLKALHTIFEQTPEQLKTFQPYISYVRNHWHKDVLFEPDDYVEDMNNKYGDDYVTKDTITAIEELKASSYQIYEYNDKSKQTIPFDPEGVTADEFADELKVLQNNASGQMLVELTPDEDSKQVKQVNQPLVISNEKHHWKVKNWLKNGYFFIYDGNRSTAREIKRAKEFLKEQEEVFYDSEDPLLGAEDWGSSDIVTSAIDDRAKEINKILKDEGFKVKLQKISFEKKSALTAFSILESVHTRDAEYVYRDLKELLIELGYFSKSDFATIELGVLEWIIPEYAPQNWPMKRYEKDDNNYETLILSKKSIDELKEKEVENEENENSDPTNNIKKIDCDGFEAGKDVIAPEKCKVTKIEGDTITLKFTSINKVKDFTLKIEGISINPDITKGMELNKKQHIGTTTDNDIKLLLKDSIKAVVNNIEDYMNPKSKKVARVDQPYEFTEDDVELIAKLVAHEGTPAFFAGILGDSELGMEASKVTAYVLVNRALVNFGGYGETLLEQLTAPGQYAGANTLEQWKNVPVTEEDMEVAEWVSKYDCNSVLSPKGEAMTRNVLGQSGWCQCSGNPTPGTNCWWWIDTTKDGTPTEANHAGDPPYDTFYCKNDAYPED